MKKEIFLFIIISFLLFGCAYQGKDFSSPTNTFLTFQTALKNNDFDLLKQTVSKKESISIEDMIFMHSSTKKQLLNTMVLKEHIYEDIAELEVEVTFIDGGEEHKMVEIFSSPLVLENGEWKFYGKAKKVCYDDESCYFNNNDCFNSKWSKIKDFELISFDPGNHDKICHCGRYSECVLQDISGKRCSSDEDCYYHVGYDSCFNEAHFKEQKWEMITAHPENPSITCSCTDTLCTRVDIDNQT